MDKIIDTMKTLVNNINAITKCMNELVKTQTQSYSAAVVNSTLRVTNSSRERERENSTQRTTSIPDNNTTKKHHELRKPKDVVAKISSMTQKIAQTHAHFGVLINDVANTSYAEI